MHISELLKRVSKRDSALLYSELFFTSAQKRFDGISYELIALEMNRRGCTTSRGADFTAAVVRSCVAELVSVGALVREQIASARFNLSVLEESDASDRDTQRVERSQEKNALGDGVLERYFDSDARETENRVSEQSGASSDEGLACDAPYACARVNENNKNNKTINQSIKQSFDLVEEREEEKKENCSSSKESAASESFRDERRAASDAQTVDQAMSLVDFGTPKARAFRAELVDSIYEPGMHADLIDRIVAARALGIASESEIQAAIEHAKEERETSVKSNGFRGKKYLWQTICPLVKNWFETAGYQWTPTSFKREPAPRRVYEARRRFDEERVLAAHDAVRAKLARDRVARREGRETRVGMA